MFTVDVVSGGKNMAYEKNIPSVPAPRPDYVVLSVRGPAASLDPSVQDALPALCPFADKAGRPRRRGVGAPP